MRGVLRKACALVALGLVACAELPPADTSRAASPSAARFRAASFASLPGWSEDRLVETWPAWIATCGVLAKRASATWGAPCELALSLDPVSDAAVRAYFEREFTPYQIIAGDGGDTGLVTGYFEALVRGSRTRHDRFQTPVYAKPDDLLTIELGALYPELEGKRVRGRLDGRQVVPYWSRADIAAGRAGLEARAIFYADDPLSAFFLEVQGSGRVSLDDGSTIRVGYADQNGHPYRAIGRVLVERGELAAAYVTMQSITRWAQTHETQLTGLMNENPSYVFFRESAAPVDPLEGPQGSFGLPLPAQRSVAVDSTFVPPGTPLFLATTRPSSNAPLQRLVVALDTGGAIRGPLRVDYFWGFGGDAEYEAGLMKARGRLWLLWPNTTRPPGG